MDSSGLALTHHLRDGVPAVLADPPAAAGSVAVDGDVIRASVAAAWRTLIAVVEVVATHDAHESVVMGEGEADTHGIFLRLWR